MSLPKKSLQDRALANENQLHLGFCCQRTMVKPCESVVIENVKQIMTEHALEVSSLCWFRSSYYDLQKILQPRWVRLIVTDDQDKYCRCLCSWDVRQKDLSPSYNSSWDGAIAGQEAYKYITGSTAKSLNHLIETFIIGISEDCT